MYRLAATDIRLSSWDSAIPPPNNEAHLPEVFWHPTLKQYGPQDIQTIHNPLYSHVSNPRENEVLVMSPLEHWGEAKRAPATNISLEVPTSMNNRINDALWERSRALVSSFFFLFFKNRDLNSFATRPGLQCSKFLLMGLNRGNSQRHKYLQWLQGPYGV